MWGKGNNKNTTVRVEKIDTLIASNVVINGDVNFSGGIQIDGKVVGNVIASEQKGSIVRITDQGIVEGEIRGPNVIINGKVDGDVYSTEHLELAANAVVTGNVHYNLIEMVMGSSVNGSLVHMGEEEPSKEEKKMTSIGSKTSSKKSEEPKKDLPSAEATMAPNS